MHMIWLNMCACLDWIYVHALIEYVWTSWLNTCAYLDWICEHDLTEYVCMTWLNINAWLHWVCLDVCMTWLKLCVWVHDLTESVCMASLNLCIWLNLICAWLNLICVHALTEYVCILTWLNMCTWLDWICVYDLIESVCITSLNLCMCAWLDWICVNGLGEQTSMSLPEQALPKYNEQRKRRTSGMWSWWTCGSQFVPRLLCHSSAPVLRSSMPYCKPSPVNYFTYSQYNYVNYCISYYTSSVTFYKYIRHQYRAMQTTEHTIA